jgi:hypothetical protein
VLSGHGMIAGSWRSQLAGFVLPLGHDLGPTRFGLRNGVRIGRIGSIRFGMRCYERAGGLDSNSFGMRC